MANLSMRGVSKRFGSIAAVSDLSLDIQSGEFFVLLGPSGAGKSTTLRLIAGLEQPDQGQIKIADRDVTLAAPNARDVAFVFQQYSLYPHLSVFDNLAFPLRSPLRNLNETAIREKVEHIAKLLRIDDKLLNPATRLSGGQMQRVAIGRALVRDPSLYLMDEPLSSLDAKLRSDLRFELKRIQQDLGATFVYVTHDQIEALTMASRIGVLEQGHLAQVGTPRQIYEEPASIYVATRLGMPRINLFKPTDITIASMPESVTTVGVRAEHLHISSQDTLLPNSLCAPCPARVLRIERLSDQYIIHVALQSTQTELVCATGKNPDLEPNAVAWLQIEKALFFSEDGARISTLTTR
jgi:multiple sugar transport system ATP-binding protein